MPVVVNILDAKGNKAGTMDVSDGVLGVELNANCVRQTLDAFLANQRLGTHKAKSRGEVRGSRRKLFKQKGTGNARPGDIKSPLRPGGGIAFGPRPHRYTQRVNKKMRRQALLGALSEFQRGEALFAIEGLEAKEPSTRQMAAQLEELGAKGRILVVFDAQKDEQGDYTEASRNVLLSLRNLPHVTVATPGSLNIFDLLTSDSMVATRGSLARIEEVFG